MVHRTAMPKLKEKKKKSNLRQVELHCIIRKNSLRVPGAFLWIQRFDYCSMNAQSDKGPSLAGRKINFKGFSEMV